MHRLLCVVEDATAKGPTVTFRRTARANAMATRRAMRVVQTFFVCAFYVGGACSTRARRTMLRD